MVLKTIEINHPIIEPLLAKSDQELLALFHAHPDLGRYLVVIFCRYGQIIYTLTRESGRSAVEAEYLFGKTWGHIYRELKLLNLEATKPLQNFLIDITAVAINTFDANLDTHEHKIKYDLCLTPPILLCYLNQALDQIPKDLRLVLTLSQTFNWSSSRIAAYLKSEGELQNTQVRRIKDIDELISQANVTLTQLLPQDIQEIYLAPNSKLSSP